VILKKIPVSNINHWYIQNVMTMEEYSLRKNIHPRIITLYDAFFYHPSTIPESVEKEKERSISKSAKSQTLASNIKNKFKNLNRVLRGGKKKKRKDNKARIRRRKSSKYNYLRKKNTNQRNNSNSRPKLIKQRIKKIYIY